MKPKWLSVVNAPYRINKSEPEEITRCVYLQTRDETREAANGWQAVGIKVSSRPINEFAKVRRAFSRKNVCQLNGKGRSEVVGIKRIVRAGMKF